ncbi:hypothetical protein ARMGADRAFT_1036496 [Armillaria gallica]|uniref:Uncharacterized protein n=1 Tax=Armillaria gallica TaxID=47427 RepID=A0A2H3CQ68_ARMGA|nr:hypothetical protein ARMGADRAFT_1036496 [Armillaria gallica]
MALEREFDREGEDMGTHQQEYPVNEWVRVRLLGITASKMEHQWNNEIRKVQIVTMVRTVTNYGTMAIDQITSQIIIFWPTTRHLLPPFLVYFKLQVLEQEKERLTDLDPHRTASSASGQWSMRTLDGLAGAHHRDKLPGFLAQQESTLLATKCILDPLDGDIIGWGHTIDGAWDAEHKWGCIFPAVGKLRRWYSKSSPTGVAEMMGPGEMTKGGAAAALCDGIVGAVTTAGAGVAGAMEVLGDVLDMKDAIRAVAC